jgi:hypothetical protein
MMTIDSSLLLKITHDLAAQDRLGVLQPLVTFEDVASERQSRGCELASFVKRSMRACMHIDDERACMYSMST